MVITSVFETTSNAEVQRVESVYDEIDEIDSEEFIQQSNPNNTNVDEISSSSSSTGKAHSSSNDDAYLNPYQSILQTVKHHTYRSTSDVAAVSSIENEKEDLCVDICNPTYFNVEQNEFVGQSSGYSKSVYLNYSDLKKDDGQVNSGFERYDNTRLFQTDTEMRSTSQSQSSSDCAEIIHIEL